jgi:hypothetical protein
MAYLLEEDGVSRFLLENGSGDILLEQSVIVFSEEDYWLSPLPPSYDFTVTKF